MTKKSKVDPNISDLFFNTDLDHTAIHDKNGVFVQHNRVALKEAADQFLACLSRLGVSVPSSEELVRDFLDRI